MHREGKYYPETKPEKRHPGTSSVLKILCHMGASLLFPLQKLKGYLGHPLAIMLGGLKVTFCWACFNLKTCAHWADERTRSVQGIRPWTFYPVHLFRMVFRRKQSVAHPYHPVLHGGTP